MPAKIFYLVRNEDESGISGTGRVAQGVVFDNGRVAMTWLGEHPSVTVYDNLGEVLAIHGHGGKTEVKMETDYRRAFNDLKSAITIDLETVIRSRVSYDETKGLLGED